MKIFIKIRNIEQTLNIYADDQTNEIIINDKIFDFNATKFVGDISAIIFNWKDSYYNNKVLDGEEFRIKIITDNNKERIIIGKNSFPSNYGDFKKIVNEVVKLWN